MTKIITVYMAKPGAKVQLFDSLGSPEGEGASLAGHMWIDSEHLLNAYGFGPMTSGAFTTGRLYKNDRQVYIGNVLKAGGLADLSFAEKIRYRSEVDVYAVDIELSDEQFFRLETYFEYMDGGREFLYTRFRNGEGSVINPIIST